MSKQSENCLCYDSVLRKHEIEENSMAFKNRLLPAPNKGLTMQCVMSYFFHPPRNSKRCPLGSKTNEKQCYIFIVEII